MDHLTIGDASVVRIEEMVDSTFLAANFFMPFDPEALQPHLHWLAPRYYVPDRGALGGPTGITCRRRSSSACARPAPRPRASTT